MEKGKKLVLIPDHLHRYGFDTAKHVRCHSQHLRLELFSFFPGIEHKGGVHLPGAQLFAFPKGLVHNCNYSSLHSYKHAGRVNVSVERALRKVPSPALRDDTLNGVISFRQRLHTRHQLRLRPSFHP